MDTKELAWHQRVEALVQAQVAARAERSPRQICHQLRSRVTQKALIDYSRLLMERALLSSDGQWMARWYRMAHPADLFDRFLDVKVWLVETIPPQGVWAKQSMMPWRRVSTRPWLSFYWIPPQPDDDRPQWSLILNDSHAGECPLIPFHAAYLDDSGVLQITPTRPDWDQALLAVMHAQISRR